MIKMTGGMLRKIISEEVERVLVEGVNPKRSAAAKKQVKTRKYKGKTYKATPGMVKQLEGQHDNDQEIDDMDEGQHDNDQEIEDELDEGDVYEDAESDKLKKKFPWAKNPGAAYTAAKIVKGEKLGGPRSEKSRRKTMKHRPGGMTGHEKKLPPRK